MRNIYLSFLGLGGKNYQTNRFEYKKAIYEMNGRKSEETEFVQVAEMALSDDKAFDLVLIVTTQKAFDTHFESLKRQMMTYGVTPHHLIIEEEMSGKGQWDWFERILAHIEPHDSITLDLTHGYRSIPIVFSAAIYFLQQAKSISIKAVYYGAFEMSYQLGYAPIIDMKDFYIINEWADGVSRLVGDADARKLAETANKELNFQVRELNDPVIIQAFQDLTTTIRNVDINNIAQKAAHALALIKQKEKTASQTGKILLNLVIDKFAAIAAEIQPSGKYDRQYFIIQIEIIKLLLEHQLYMQAYTVMREWIASLVMILFEREGMKNGKRKKRRPRYGEAFVKLFCFDETKWVFEGKQDVLERIKPLYDEFKAAGIEAVLRTFAATLADYRNGFDHAWTAKSGAYTDIREKGEKFMKQLNGVIDLLTERGFFKYE